MPPTPYPPGWRNQVSQDVSDSQESIESMPDGLGQGEEERPIGNDVSSSPRSPVHIHHSIPTFPMVVDDYLFPFENEFEPLDLCRC